jgi:hypothetical protein
MGVQDIQGQLYGTRGVILKLMLFIPGVFMRYTNLGHHCELRAGFMEEVQANTWSSWTFQGS